MCAIGRSLCKRFITRHKVDMHAYYADCSFPSFLLAPKTTSCRLFLPNQPCESRHGQGGLHACGCARLVDRDELDLKVEGRALGDTGQLLVTVRELRGDLLSYQYCLSVPHSSLFPNANSPHHLHSTIRDLQRLYPPHIPPPNHSQINASEK